MNPFTTGVRDAIQVNTDGALSQTLHALSYPRVNTNITKDMNMPEEKQAPEWITIGQAIDHPDCKVKSRTTLHNMIERGDIPDECLDQRPLGDGERHITYIDANCLKSLPYRSHGERGHGKRN